MKKSELKTLLNFSLTEKEIYLELRKSLSVKISNTYLLEFRRFRQSLRKLNRKSHKIDKLIIEFYSIYQRIEENKLDVYLYNFEKVLERLYIERNDDYAPNILIFGGELDDIDREAIFLYLFANEESLNIGYDDFNEKVGFYEIRVLTVKEPLNAIEVVSEDSQDKIGSCIYLDFIDIDDKSEIDLKYISENSETFRKSVDKIKLKKEREELEYRLTVEVSKPLDINDFSSFKEYEGAMFAQAFSGFGEQQHYEKLCKIYGIYNSTSNIEIKRVRKIALKNSHPDTNVGIDDTEFKIVMNDFKFITEFRDKEFKKNNQSKQLLK